MKTILRITATLIALAAGGSAAEPKVRIVSTESGRLDFIRGEEGPILGRFLSTKSHGRPYLHPLRSPDGRAVLTQFSPGHHKHQTGLYWGPTRINGRDYFHNYNEKFWADTKLSHFFEIGPAHPPTVRSTSDLLDAQGNVVLKDDQKWSLRDHGSYYTLDLDWTGTALIDVTIGKYTYGGLFLRMPWKRGTPASCLNSEGDKNQAGEGKSARWVDLAMKIDGMAKMAHIAMIDHPKNNGYPTLWRIDGQFGIGPALARRGDVKIPKGESLTYRYRLVVYEGEFNGKLIEEENKSFGLLSRKP